MSLQQKSQGSRHPASCAQTRFRLGQLHLTPDTSLPPLDLLNKDTAKRIIDHLGSSLTWRRDTFALTHYEDTEIGTSRPRTGDCLRGPGLTMDAVTATSACS